MRKFLAAAASCCLLPFVIPPASGWGFKGHRVIGELAERRLAKEHPGVLAEIAKLAGPGVRLATLATCADEIRDYAREREKRVLNPPFPTSCLLTRDEVESQFRKTASWHFVNIPIPAAANRGDPDAVLSAACGEGARCITQQIDRFTKQLKNRRLNQKDRAVALMFLTHLIGDIHQPLHTVARNNDAGGNQIFVRIGRDTRKLHAAWDTYLVENTGATVLSEQDLVNLLWNANPDRTVLTANKTANSWAWESYDVARKIVYRSVPLQLTTNEAPIVLPHPAYRDRAVPQIRNRLYAASVRLADTLVAALGNP